MRNIDESQFQIATAEQWLTLPRPPRYITVCDRMAQVESRAWYEWHWARGGCPGEERRAVPDRVRRAVLSRDGLVCQLCFQQVDPDDVHLDHIKPFSRGGLETVSNLRVTHSICNIRRGNREDL